MSGNYPYWTPGWTAQHPVYGPDWQDNPNVSCPPFNPLPDDITLVTVTASYIDLLGRYFDNMITFTVVSQTADSDGVTLVLPTEFKTWLVNGQLSVQLPAGFTYSVVEGVPGGRKYQIEIPSDAPDTVHLPDLVIGDGMSTSGVGSNAWLINYASGDLDSLIVGNISRDSHGVITTAGVQWPNGATGTYTTLVFSSAFPGYADSYQVTYVTPTVTKTVTQPTVTRNPGGAVTVRPEMVVS